MGNTPARNLGVAQLRNSEAAITVSTNGTELTDARLENFRTGILLLIIAAIVVNDANETYEFVLRGRDDSAAAFAALATISLSAAAATAVAGTYFASVDRFKKRLRLDATLGGTTPSVIFSALAIATEVGYAPTLSTAVAS